jgi:hypothetical protein
MENLLYYPYINLPKSDWSSRLLLYYDTIGSIVPQEFFYSPEDNYDPFMLDLVRNELVIPINPIQVLNNPWEISRPLLEYFDSPEFLRKVKLFLNRRNGRQIENRIYSARIHSEKFDEMIFYELVNRRLAIKGEGRWFYVPPFVANVLMAFLTTVISQKLELQPTSDIMLRNRFSFRQVNYKKDLERKREIILKGLIPFPKEVDLGKLRTFKDKHIDLLKAFKNKVELIALDDHYQEGTQLFNEKLSELMIQRNELSAKMKENKIGNIFFGTICGVLGGIIGFAAASTTGAVIFGLPGLFNAIHSALKIENPNSILDQTGMKYLALIDKQFK